MITINIGRLALMPDATTDQMLDFADYVASVMPQAVVSTSPNGQKHRIAADSDAQAAAVAVKLDRMTALWAAGERRMDQAEARPTDCRALYRDTIPCPPPEGCL